MPVLLYGSKTLNNFIIDEKNDLQQMRCSSNDMLRIAWTNCGTNKKVLRIQETTKKLLLTIKEIIEIF